MNSKGAVAIQNQISNNFSKSKSLESIEKRLKQEKYSQEKDEINYKINNSVLSQSLNNEKNTYKYGYHGKRNYIGLDFAIEFCNRNFIPITDLEKLYIEKLYLHAEYHEMLKGFENINDSEILGCLYNSAVDKKQIALNLKEYYIKNVVYLIKNNMYEEAIAQILTTSELMSQKTLKK